MVYEPVAYCEKCTFRNFATRTKCLKCQTPQIRKSPCFVLRIFLIVCVEMPTASSGAAGKPANFLNSGDSDVSPDGAPSQFLLIRALEPTVTEDLLAKGIAKLYKPSRKSSPSTSGVSKKGNSKIASTTGNANLGAQEGSLRRVLLVRDRRSNESWRYGFAEFATVEVSISVIEANSKMNV